MAGFQSNISLSSFGITGNLSGTLNSTLDIDNSKGASFISCNITPPTNGTIDFQLSFDGINFESFTLRSTSNDIFVSKVTATDVLIGSIIGAKVIRFKTSVAGIAAGSIVGTLNMSSATIESIEFGYPPHRFGFIPIHKDAEYTTQQTAAAIWTPATGKKVVVTDLDVIVGGATDGTISIFNGAGDVTGERVFRATVDVSTNKNFIYSKNFKTPFIGTVDGAIKVTTSAAVTVNILLHGYEI
jgi:hypothetical protein